MRTRQKVLGLAFGVWVGLAVGVAYAPAASSGGCAITDAARKSMQKRIVMLDATKVNVSQYFNGAGSCIGTDLMKSINLSNLIPDLSGLLTSAATEAVNQLISAAKAQVCQVVNNQIQQVIGKINSQMMSFTSGLGGDMNDILGGSGNFTPIDVPNVPGLGKYTDAGSIPGAGPNLQFGALQRPALSGEQGDIGVASAAPSVKSITPPSEAEVSATFTNSAPTGFASAPPQAGMIRYASVEAILNAAGVP